MYHHQNDPDDLCPDFVFNYQEDARYLPHFLEGVIEHIYGDKPLGEDDLHHCLRELCQIAGLDIPEKEINVKRKRQKKNREDISSNLVSSWLDFNKKFNQGLTAPIFEDITS